MQVKQSTLFCKHLFIKQIDQKRIINIMKQIYVIDSFLQDILLIGSLELERSHTQTPYFYNQRYFQNRLFLNIQKG